MGRGIGLVPEDRKQEGLYLDLPISDNIGLGLLRGLGLIRGAPRSREVVIGLAERMQLRSRGLDQNVGDLSGGNQQKVMIGRLRALWTHFCAPKTLWLTWLPLCQQPSLPCR